MAVHQNTENDKKAMPKSTKSTKSPNPDPSTYVDFEGCRTHKFGHRLCALCFGLVRNMAVQRWSNTVPQPSQKPSNSFLILIFFLEVGGSFLVNCKKLKMLKNGKNKFLGLLKNVWLVENTPDSADMLFILSKKLKVLLDKEYQLTSVIK